MITAMHMAKLKACTNLLEAREKLLETRSLVCWKNDEHRVIDDIVSDVDDLLKKVLP